MMKCKNCNARWDGHDKLCPYCGAPTDGSKSTGSIDLSSLGTSSQTEYKQQKYTRPLPTVPTSSRKTNFSKYDPEPQKKQDQGKKPKKKGSGCLTYIIWIIILIVIMNLITRLLYGDEGDGSELEDSVTYVRTVSYEFPTEGDEYRVDQDETEEYAYDKNDYLLRYTFYDENGELEYAYTITYDGVYNIIAMTYYYFEDGDLDEYSVETYASGLVAYESFYDGNDQLEYTCIYEYDENDQIIRIDQEDTDGTILYSCTYEYDDEGQIQLEYYYDADGTLEGFDEYTYDEDGNIENIEWYDAEEE